MRQDSQEYRRIEKDYHRKMAIVTWRDGVWRVALGVLVVFEFAALVFFAWNSVWYLAQTSFADRALFAQAWDDFVPFTDRIQARAPQEMLLGEVSVMAVEEGFDLVASIENPNVEHYATFFYTFISDVGETERALGFILPGETKFVAQFGFLSKRPSNTRLRIYDVVWMEVDRHAIVDTTDWISDRINFPVTDVAYRSVPSSGAFTTFTITNESTFSYWEPAFLVLLQRGTSILGVARITVPQFVQHTARTITAQWFGEYPSTATVKIIPDIYLFDERVYKE